MKFAYDVIIKPVITEKSMESVDDKKYVFKVAKDANKIEIKKAVEEIFGVKVMKVTTINMQGKKKRLRTAVPGSRPDWKKAIVKLTPDSKTIEFFEGMV
jgi:large subunit ribosomal protein L23